MSEILTAKIRHTFSIGLVYLGMFIACSTAAIEPVRSLLAHEGERSVPLTWYNSTNADFSGVLILRQLGTQPVGIPVNGTAYVTNTTLAGSLITYYGPGNDPMTNSYSGWTDENTLPATVYYYGVFAFDTLTNYSVGQYVGGAPPATNGVIYVDSRAVGGDTGTSWFNAFSNLQTAIASVGALGDEMWVAEGTYYPTTNEADRTAHFVMKAGLEIFGGFAGDEKTRNSRDWTNHPSILSGDINKSGTRDPGDTTRGIVYVNQISGVIVDGFTVEHGWCDPVDGGQGSGGIYLDGCDAVVRNCIVRDCYGDRGGGIGIYGKTTLNHATIVNCVIFNNSAVKGGAMGVYHNYEKGTVTRLLNCTFYGNSTDSGAIYVSAGGILNAVNCIFWDSGSNGGGILIKPVTTHCWGTVNYCDVSGGWNPGVYGDGADNFNVDPKFFNAASGDFNLQDTSPCINVGTPVPPSATPVMDGNNHSRIYPDEEGATNSIIDLGAFEWPSWRYNGPPNGTIITVNQIGDM